ncbi:MAG TPA: type II toxin-antitoxin system HicB family antitoxin [Acidimicrobiales bacterium]|nr:type II toxin-antitoxin system HicB family antitoxin [Acidimicrobiales bacterium]
MTKHYTARYDFEEGDWLVEIAEIPQVHTFGRTLAKARANVRDALGLWLRAEDPTSLDIKEEFSGIPADLAGQVSEASQSRVRANELLSRSQQLTAAAARRLVDELGMSTRDAAELLGVSHQRIHQLLHQPRARSA